MPTKAPPLRLKGVFHVVMAIIPRQKAQPNALFARSTATPLFSLPPLFQNVYVMLDMLWSEGCVSYVGMLLILHKGLLEFVILVLPTAIPLPLDPRLHLNVSVALDMLPTATEHAMFVLLTLTVWVVVWQQLVLSTCIHPLALLQFPSANVPSILSSPHLDVCVTMASVVRTMQQRLSLVGNAVHVQQEVFASMAL
jgi:hypothetical protein